MHPYVGCIKLILIKSPPYTAKVLTLEAETFLTTWDILLYVVKQRTINSKPFHILANLFFCDLCKELFLNVSSINLGILTVISKIGPAIYPDVCQSVFSICLCMTNLKIWDHYVVGSNILANSCFLFITFHNNPNECMRYSFHVCLCLIGFMQMQTFTCLIIFCNCMDSSSEFKEQLCIQTHDKV